MIKINAIYTNKSNKQVVVTNIFKNYNNSKRIIIISPLSSTSDYSIDEDQFNKEFTAVTPILSMRR